MIETTNNIIFYAGYFCMSGIFIYIGITSYMRAYELLMGRKWFFKMIFDKALNDRLENTTDKNFNLWIEKIKDKYDNIKENKKGS